jgi:hypothetical protein
VEQNQEKQAIEVKLARCRELAQEFRDGPTAQMIYEFEEELRQQLRMASSCLMMRTESVITKVLTENARLQAGRIANKLP